MDLRLSMQQVAEGVIDHGPELGYDRATDLTVRGVTTWLRLPARIARTQLSHPNRLGSEATSRSLARAMGVSTYTRRIDETQYPDDSPRAPSRPRVRSRCLPVAAAGRQRRQAKSQLLDTQPKGDGVLTVGTSCSRPTGDLAFLGPPEFAGVDPAVKDINDAGGVYGKPVVQSKADSGDGTPNIAPGSVDKLLAAKADVDRRCGLVERLAERHRQDRRRRCRGVLARQHLDRVRHLRRQGPVLPYRSV